MRETYKVIEKWFDALERKEFDTVISLMDDNIHWINCRIVPGANDSVPWLGEFFNKADVLESLGRFINSAKAIKFELYDIHVDGEYALTHVHEECEVLKNGKTFMVDDIFKMQVKNGKVVYWESFWDPSGAVKAFQD